MTDKHYVPISQDEAGYVELSPNMPAEACANCRFFITHGCTMIESEPLDILPTGWCSRWEAPPEMDIPDGSPVILADTVVISTDEEKALDDALQRPGVLERLLKTIREAVGGKEPVTGFKDLGGNLWMGVYSNNFEDREKEIISEAAFDRYVRRVQKGMVPMPELWFWHIKGTRHGQAQWVDRIGHFMVAVGTYDDDEFSKAMRAHYARKRGKPYGMSHGFATYRDARTEHDGYAVLHDLNTWEISPLPDEKAANVMTLYDDMKGIEMASKESLAALRDILISSLGEEKGSAVYEERVGGLEEAGKSLEALGVRFKDFTDPVTAAQESAEKQALDKLKEGVAPVLLDLTEGFGDVVNVQHKAAQEVEQVKAELAAEVERRKQAESATADLAKRVEALEKEMALTPQSVVVDTTGGQVASETTKGLAAEYDEFFGDMRVKKS